MGTLAYLCPGWSGLCRRLQAAAAAFVVLLIYVPCATAQSPAQVSSPCQGDSQPLAVRDAKSALEKHPNELQPLLNLADALLDQGCNQDAASALEAGRPLHPRSGELQDKLRIVRSMLTEQVYIEGIDKAQESAQLQRNLLRCTQLADVPACDEALKSRPDDLQLVLAKGDALMQANHPADAMLVYRHATALKPGNEAVKGKLAAALTQRQTLLSRCETGMGVAAVQACDAALLRGAQDEFTIDRRKGILLQSMNQPGPALDSYIAANVLKHDDESVALAIIALTDSTGRRDPVALAARGTALLALGRSSEGSATLRQATSLTPTLPGVSVQLQPPKQTARAKPRRPEAAPASSASGAAKSSEVAGGLSAVTAEARADKRTYSNEEPADHTN